MVIQRKQIRLCRRPRLIISMLFFPDLSDFNRRNPSHVSSLKIKSLSRSTFALGTVSYLKTQQDGMRPLIDASPIPTHENIRIVLCLHCAKSYHAGDATHSKRTKSEIAWGMTLKSACGQMIESPGNLLLMAPNRMI